MRKDKLTIKNFSINHVNFDNSYRLDSHQLSIPNSVLFELNKGIKEINIKILNPNDCHISTNTIMDVIPISTKVIGEIGWGLTHTLTGTCAVLTGSFDSGIQLHEFGSSNGFLNEKIQFGLAGTPDWNDQIILFDVILDSEIPFDREACNLVFETLDQYLQPIRELLKITSGRDADESVEFELETHPGKPKVAIVKEIAAQGAMYDNVLFSKEPNGLEKGISIIDMNSMPMILTANEYRDGVIHALV